jgi:DNA-binding NarL/FixJ family response regulator
MRVLVVDDQRLFREGLCAWLRANSHVEVVGQAANAREAYGLVPRLRPDVVTIELLLSGVDGVTTAQEIRRLRPECRLVMLTGCQDRRLLRAAWLSGIDACLGKDEAPATLLAAFAAVRAGERYLGPGLRKVGSMSEVADEKAWTGCDPVARLSRRERVVFDLVVRGYSTKAVARELCISTKTVETHRAHINEKLAAHCTADLVRFAFRDSVPVPLAAGWGSEAKRGKAARPGRSPAPKARPQA